MGITSRPQEVQPFQQIFPFWPKTTALLKYKPKTLRENFPAPVLESDDMKNVIKILKG